MVEEGKPCVFCQIANHSSSTRTDLLYSDENVISFRDIKPSAFRHYLVIPVHHIPTTRDLHRGPEDFQLVSHMLNVGQNLLLKDAPASKVKFGFHQPPFNSVDHLHLHCLALPFIPRWHRKEVHSARAMAEEETSCLFCQISKDPASTHTDLLYSDESVVAFQDIKPAAFRHYLVIPVQHVPTTRDLRRRSEDYQLVSHMLSVGQNLLLKDAPSSKTEFGFHHPPFNSVNHLHLHCLALPFIPRWKFTKYWASGSDGRFVVANKLLKRIKPDEIQAETGSVSQDLGEPSNLKRIKKFPARLFHWNRRSAA